MIELYSPGDNQKVLEINKDNHYKLGYCGLYYMIDKEGYYYVDMCAKRIEPGDFMVSSYQMPKIVIKRKDFIEGLFNGKYTIL